MAKSPVLAEWGSAIDAVLSYTWTVEKMNSEKTLSSPNFSDSNSKYTFNLKLFEKRLHLTSFNTTEVFIKFITRIVDPSGKGFSAQNIVGVSVAEGNCTVVSRPIPQASFLTQNESFYREQIPKFAFSCTVFIMNQNYISNISRSLNAMFVNMKFNDVTLVVQGKEFPAHKVFLTSRSPVFNAMFENKMEESKTNQVFIQDVSHDAFREMLRFIYNGKVENLKSMASELLGVADKYALEELKEMCENELGLSLNIENTCEILQLADLHNASNLKTVTIKFINNNAKNVIKSANWKNMAKENPELVNQLYCQLVEMQER